MRPMIMIIFGLIIGLTIVHLLAGCSSRQEFVPVTHRHDNDTMVVIVGDQAAAEMEMGCMS
jgi:hypothetical protein